MQLIFKDETFLYAMAIFYIAAGIMHFVKPKLYISIIPPYIPYPKLVNMLVGGMEVVLGAGLLFEPTRIAAAYGIILLLIAVFPANLYMYQKKNKGIPKWLLFLRLPLQLLLIGWAYSYT
ncbi:MAG: MauE/DoxX family redox-associated membrane protein [Cyclobacteriaceae bacterium]